jgi:acyl-CoA dehydrogenase
VWRYEVENDPAMLPVARAAIRLQLHETATLLRELYANLPSAALRAVAPLILHGTGHLAPLRDREAIALADALRTQPALMRRLCPDVSRPMRGGLLDLMRALEAAGQLGDEVPELNKALRRAGSLEAVAKGARNPEAALAYLQAAEQVIRVDED